MKIRVSETVQKRLDNNAKRIDAWPEYMKKAAGHLHGAGKKATPSGARAMDATQIVRAAIPDASEGLCQHVLWGMTPFPFGHVGARDLYQAADRLRRAQANGIQLCPFCDNIAEPDAIACRRCDAALSSNAVLSGRRHSGK